MKLMFYNEKIETLSREEMRKIQSEKLKRMVAHAYKNVPLYKQRLDEAGVTPDDIQSIDDIVKLPFTYKTDLRDNYPYGMLAVPMTDIVRVHASSGTTGKQTVVAYNRNDLENWSECVARGLVAIGASKEDIFHISYGYGLFTGGLGLHDGAQKLGAAVIPASTGNTSRQMNIIKDFKPSVICCTPSYALYLGESLNENGIKPEDTNLKIGIFGAEPWTEEMRKEIEDLLGIKAYDIYGLSEIAGPGVACECTAQAGMHVQEDNYYPEILDPDTGMPVPDGQPGELVFTCLSKEALPLIRYRTHDIATITHEKCACGRTTVRMSKPIGRSDDMLIIRGVNVFPSQVEDVLLKIKEGVTPYYKIIVDRINNLDTMELLVEMDPAIFSDTIKHIEATERKVKAAVESTLGIAVKVRLVEPKTIERSEGKAKRVEDRRKI